ncbi:MAG: restriction endonuclease subunit S [Candidatus Poribacteria bacterium]|nr:restriction endonuclease subunit S [Candidatus Poribacteria bacterium]
MNCYLAYKDSQLVWVGEIPHHWRTIKFRYLSQESRRKNDDDVDREMLSLSSYTGVQLKQYEYENTKRTKDESLTYLVVEPNQLVVNPMWQMKRSIGVSYLHGIVSPGYRVYFVDLERLVPQYLHHLMRSDNYVDEYNKHVRGATTYDRSVKKEDFEEIGVLLPPKEEQAQIANFLDHKTAQIDELIRAKERKMELLGEYRASLINQAVTKGLDADVEMKPSGVDWIGEIPKHWTISKVKHELESLDYLRVPLNSETRGSLKSKVYDYYGASGVIDKVETYIFDEPLILIGEDGANLYLRSTPLAFKATGKYWVNNHAHVLRPKYGNIDYLTNILESLDYTHYISGAAQPKLTAGRLMNIVVVIPPLSEQNQIADFINRKAKQIDELRSNEEGAIKLLKEYRQSLISEVVTGKIDVRGEA